MKIIAHRGYWNVRAQSNTPTALQNALKRGYGIETDLRDHKGNLVISHDLANENSQRAEEVFRWLAELDDRCSFAINIKADGLKDLLRKCIVKYGIHNYFLFDMSVPQMVEFQEMGLRFYTRQSEYETIPSLYEQATGIWMDGFRSTDWITKELLAKHLSAGKELCLVSPELHGKKEYRKFWETLKGYDLDFKKVMLCTDYPDEAAAFFGNGI